MPRIPDYIADSVIYFYPSERAAKEGQSAGGSGFLVTVPSIPGIGHLYAVTNRHLVDGTENGSFFTIRVTLKSGGVDCIVTRKEDWLLHEDGDDIAVLPLGMKDHVKWWSVPTTQFLDREGVEVYGIGYGDDVFLVGRLISQSGRKKNTPAVRSGIISLPCDPEEPIKYRGEEHEAFLVECRSVSGFSGSPVFVMTDRLFVDDRARRVIEYERKRDGVIEGPIPSGMQITVTSMDRRVGPLLLGLDFGHLPIRGIVYQKNRSTDYEVETNTGIAGVVPAWKIVEVLDTPKLAEDRAKENAGLKKKLEGLPNTFVLDAAKEFEGKEFTLSDLDAAIEKVSRQGLPPRSE
jgi:Trypsin-like peptidase domain